MGYQPGIARRGRRVGFDRALRVAFACTVHKIRLIRRGLSPDESCGVWGFAPQIVSHLSDTNAVWLRNTAPAVGQGKALRGAEE